MRGQPVVLSSGSDRGDQLERIEARSEDGRNEAWLQSVIFEHPEILPVAYFDENYAPVVPVGREISTSSGYIDNLYISPSGAITIVETKLWTNPEKHRTVVAQIIDYAKELSQWSFDDLNAAVLNAARRENETDAESLSQLINPFLEEAGLTLVDFQERVISTLRNGEFLLLIIGDVISPNLALLTDSISGVPGLDFRLGLVELQLYRLDKSEEWPLLVVPEIVGRTVERTRGVIKVQYIQERPKLEIEIEDEESSGQLKGKTTKQVFLQKTPEDLADVYSNWLDTWQDKDVVIYWGVEGFSLRVSIDGKLRTVTRAYPEWAVALVRKIEKDQLKISDADYDEYKETISNVDKASEVLLMGKKYAKHEFLTAEDLMIILQATDKLVDRILGNED
jgi:hypothetical protein